MPKQLNHPLATAITNANVLLKLCRTSAGPLSINVSELNLHEMQRIVKLLSAALANSPEQHAAPTAHSSESAGKDTSVAVESWAGSLLISNMCQLHLSFGQVRSISLCSAISMQQQQPWSV